ncbi:Undecaprenyl-phosphate 4-deoxy-4-formamido-L-arabinose transferase [Porphyromonas levii]|nr:Undecaprenyl-phosphate 4-deoxy-4-formamido-L-arabinose transferase [Porphyromonas levii]
MPTEKQSCRRDNMDISFIIPIYNRPDELRELLHSFTQLDESGVHYEIIVVEDGSTNPSEEVIRSFDLPIRYITQENTGPGGARNRGADAAKGEWVIFLDSDAVLPNHYMVALEKALQNSNCDLWGGPDRAREDFTLIQKAIDYSMTSLLTTGGIRGKKGSVDRFYPRTFNMGIRRSLFAQLKGFRNGMRYGEDLDLSMRALAIGGKSELFEEVWVYHKRRGTFADFFRQIRHSGRARIVLNKYHPGTLKLAHTLPTLFVLFNIVVLLSGSIALWGILVAYILAIVFDVYAKGQSLELAGYAVAATYVQHFAYGIGFAEQLLGINKE